MAKLKQLRERWHTAQGEQTLQHLSAALQQHKSIEELKAITVGLPHIEDIEPALDIRAMPMDSVGQFHKIDLSGASLEHIEFFGGFIECKMVATNFNKIIATNKLFNGDFAKASFVGAKLNGSRFKTIRLTDADFSKARMMRAELIKQKLQNTCFVQADLRTAELAGSDIRGADFSGADCTDATFGEVRFDESTRLKDCKLSTGYMDSEFEAYAREQGAEIVGQIDQSGYQEIDATIAVLKSLNQNQRHENLITKLHEIRERAGKDIQWDWLDYLAGQISKDQARVLQGAFEEGYRHMEHYLG